jgi:hypothetical protein
MSGRVHPDDVIAALYRVVDDHQLPWLDDLLIAAGFMRRCPCVAMAPADEPCPVCGGATVDFFDVYRCTPEAAYSIDPLHDGDPALEIRIAAAGGGEVGDAYAGNDWIYSVWLDGALWQSGADLRSGGIPKTHAQMSAILADALASRDLPTALADRLTVWAQEQEAGDA